MTNYSQQIPDEFVGKLIDIGFKELSGETGYTWVPTYGETFDWLSKNYGLVITLKPFFTRALLKNIAYFWIISFITKTNLGCPTLRNIEEDNVYTGGGYGGSFDLTANDAIREAFKLIENRTVTKIKYDDSDRSTTENQ